MAMRKRKPSEADDGSYAGAVLGAFDRMVSGETPASEIELSPAQRARLQSTAKKFHRSMQAIANRSGGAISIEMGGKKLAEFKPRGKEN